MTGFNSTDVELPALCQGRALIQIFEHWAASNPSGPCVMYGKSLLSYREVDAKANQLSRHLAGLGVVPGSCVGVMMERSLGKYVLSPCHLNV